MTCNKNHRYLPEFDSLPDSQANTENDRHKCAGCSYVLGLKDALNGQPKQNTLPKAILDSQAGSVRHKDAMSAYDMGYQRGSELNS